MSDREDAVGLLQMLLGRFRVAKHANLGDCLVVPADSFEAEWDDCLTQVTEVHGVGGYVFVKLPKEFVPEKSVDSSPLSSPRKKRRGANLVVEKPKPDAVESGRGRGPNWTAEEERLLIEVAGDGTLTMEQIYVEFVTRKPDDVKYYPLRSFSAVCNRLSALRKAGRVAYAKQVRGQKKKGRRRVHEESPKPVCREEVAEVQGQVDSSSGKNEVFVTDSISFKECSWVAFDGMMLHARIRREDLAVWESFLEVLKSC